MNKCGINEETLKQIKKMTARVFLLHNKEHGTVSTLKSNINQMLQDVVKDNFQLEWSQSIAEVINSEAIKRGITAQVPNFFEVQNINNLLIAAKEGVAISDSKEASTEHLTDVPQIRSRIDASRDFIDKSFGLAKELGIKFQNITDENLFDCLFINRGSVNQNIGIVKNTRELNDNIRNYQNILLKNIVDYLNSEFRGKRLIRENLSDEVKQALKNPVMYDENNKYTGVLETLQPLIDSYIKQPLLGNTDVLREVYASSENAGDPNQKLSKQKLAAFNSMVMLNNFDTYLSVLLGKALQIKDFNQKTGEDKYQIAGKTAKLATTWRVSENIFVEDEADAITKLAINTTPLYNWGSNTPKEGYYLSFSNFQHLIAKIKDLVYNPEASKIVFDKNFKKSNKNLYNKLPEEVKDLTLSTLINIVRRNPRRYLHTIFDILSNDNFKIHILHYTKDLQRMN